MISDIHVLIDDGGITISLALGCRVVARSVCKTKCIRLSSRNVCLEHPEATHHVIELFTNSLDIFLRKSSFFAFGFSWAWTAATIVVSDFQRRLVDLWLSGAGRQWRWCGVTSTHSAIIAVHIRIVIRLSKNFPIWKCSTAHIHVRNGIIKNQTPPPCVFQTLLPILHSCFTLHQNKSPATLTCTCIHVAVWQDLLYKLWCSLLLETHEVTNG